MRWWRRVLRRSEIEQELDAELRDHVERQVVDYVTRGISEPQARRRVHMEFGGLEQIKEMCRDVDRTRWLDALVQDIRYGVRVFRRNPSFTLAAALSLALGIGANTAIFTLVNATMLKPLPITQPERLLELLTDLGTGTPGNAFSYRALGYFRDHANTLDIIASHDSRFFVATNDNGPELANGQYVTGDFFQILGVSPTASGRTIESSDDRVGAPLVVVLSHRYWQTRFQGTDSLIGETMRVNDRVFSIIGIAPASFRGLRPAIEVDVWVPLASEPLLRSPSNMTSASYNWLQIVGRARTIAVSTRPEQSCRRSTTRPSSSQNSRRRRTPATEPCSHGGGLSSSRPARSLDRPAAVRTAADRAPGNQRRRSPDCVNVAGICCLRGQRDVSTKLPGAILGATTRALYGTAPDGERLPCAVRCSDRHPHRVRCVRLRLTILRRHGCRSHWTCARTYECCVYRTLALVTALIFGMGAGMADHVARIASQSAARRQALAQLPRPQNARLGCL